MDISDIRRKNLADLVQRIGSQRKAGQLFGISESLMSQYKNGMKDIGNDQARRIETASGIERGWMDQVHEGARASAIRIPSAAPASTDKKDVVCWVMDQLAPELQDNIVAYVLKMGATAMTAPTSGTVATE